MTRIVGADIGGANLKYVSIADSAEPVASSRHYAMWRYPEKLAATLVEDLRSDGGIDALAITMTGELADCFVDRAAGVDHIVGQVEEAAEQLGISDVAFYGVDGSFQRAVARQQTDLMAASNWHALASFVGSQIEPSALLIDIGSTTTDIIPVKSNVVATRALTDYDRLGAGSLVYVGCRRTPVCALVDALEFRGRTTPVMNELFATIDDARIMLGHIDELPDDKDSADGKPRTQQFASNRLARMIGLDHRSVTRVDAISLASQVHKAAKMQIAESLATVSTIDTVVLSGHGDDLVDLPASNHVMRLADRLGAEVSRCAPAYAVAWLLQQQLVQ